MKASELRIGNIIKDDRKAKDWRFTTHRIISDLASSPHIELYHPIPLTEEWLIKFGYLAEVGTYRFSKPESFPSLYIDTYINRCWLEANTDVIFLDYPESVHTFQNLHHAVYNEELTIKKKAIFTTDTNTPEPGT